MWKGHAGYYKDAWGNRHAGPILSPTPAFTTTPNPVSDVIDGATYEFRTADIIRTVSPTADGTTTSTLLIRGATPVWYPLWSGDIARVTEGDQIRVDIHEPNTYEVNFVGEWEDTNTDDVGGGPQDIVSYYFDADWPLVSVRDKTTNQQAIVPIFKLGDQSISVFTGGSYVENQYRVIMSKPDLSVSLSADADGVVSIEHNFGQLVFQVWDKTNKTIVYPAAKIYSTTMELDFGSEITDDRYQVIASSAKWRQAGDSTNVSDTIAHGEATRDFDTVFINPDYTFAIPIIAYEEINYVTTTWGSPTASDNDWKWYYIPHLSSRYFPRYRIFSDIDSQLGERVSADSEEDLLTISAATETPNLTVRGNASADELVLSASGDRGYPTLVIAPHNTQSPVAHNADYILDGNTNDWVYFYNALNRLGSDGGRIIVLDGDVYAASVDMYFPCDGIEFCGSGVGATRFHSTDFNIDYRTNSKFKDFEVIGGSPFRVSSYVYGPGDIPEEERIIFEDILCRDTGYAFDINYMGQKNPAIADKLKNGVILRNVRMFGGAGVRIMDGRYITIDGCEFNGTTSNTLIVGTETVLDDDVTFIEILDSKFIRCDHSVFILDAANVVMRDCLFRDVWQWESTYYPEYEQVAVDIQNADSVQISNVTVRGSTDGVYIDGGDTKISDSLFDSMVEYSNERGNTFTSFMMSGCEIAGTSREYGINVKAGNFVNINNNVISGADDYGIISGAGIRIEDTDNGLYEPVLAIIKDNKITNGTRGIVKNYDSNIQLTIEGNEVHDNTEDGIYIDNTGYDSTNEKPFTVISNKLYNNGASGLYLDSIASATTGLRNRVVDNEFMNSDDYGIEMRDGSEGIAIVNNMFHANGSYQIYVNDYLNDSMISDNVFTNSSDNVIHMTNPTGAEGENLVISNNYSFKTSGYFLYLYGWHDTSIVGNISYKEGGDAYSHVFIAGADADEITLIHNSFLGGAQYVNFGTGASSSSTNQWNIIGTTPEVNLPMWDGSSYDSVMVRIDNSIGAHKFQYWDGSAWQDMP